MVSARKMVAAGGSTWIGFSGQFEKPVPSAPRRLDAASRLGVSVRTVYSAFAAIDATHAQYIRHQRVESAAVRLRSSAVPITDIAISLGFGDVTTFVRCFKRLHGVTPSEWRKMAR